VVGGVPVESGRQTVQVGGGELPLERLVKPSRSPASTSDCLPQSRTAVSARSKILGHLTDRAITAAAHFDDLRRELRRERAARTRLLPPCSP
jgi:hypothetical protein